MSMRPRSCLIPTLKLKRLHNGCQLRRERPPSCLLRAIYSPDSMGRDLLNKARSGNLESLSIKLSYDVV